MGNSFTATLAGLTGIMNGSIDLDSDTLKVMLVDDTYVFDRTEANIGDIVDDEVSGTGYTGGFGGAGRKTLANKAVATSGTEIVLNADAVQWDGIDVGNIDGAVLVKEVTNDADSIVIGYMPFTTQPYVSDGSTLLLDFSAATGVPLFKLLTQDPA